MNSEITENLVDWGERIEYDDFGVPRNVHEAIYACPDCGALVSAGSLDTHILWHKSIVVVPDPFEEGDE